MDTIVVITTGGTIASTSDGTGGQAASASADQVLGDLAPPPGTTLRAVDLFRINSAALGLADLDEVAGAVAEALADPTTRGVVVTHGTDTMEETALLLDLQHDDPRPVVLTGAQRGPEHPDPDGPANLAAAVAAAASEETRDLGALVCFAGEIHQAAGTRKVHNAASAAFADPDRGPVGTVVDGTVRVHTRRPRGVRRPRTAISGTRVDVVPCYPGVDRTALDAVVAAGAAGIVLEAPGTGNTSPAMVAAVAEHVAAGVVVVTSTRVHAGDVRAVYGGGGGGVDLLAAGAELAGALRPSQARILLAVLLAGGADRATVREAFSPGLSAGSTPPTG
ncbi:asparaginase domain-containing protein [Nocardioides panacisoli]|uniref:asparaginase domain-containing protein n=1 Tax=Nocardioides panacisoli TaxID=627624 RepID=UPI001C638C5E|nr:asparaginase domain-containing protein [Nocardioides panacisoli]QYJ05102.1 asparaginase domain-containing protein [Nocardioides panacisoli]